MNQPNRAASRPAVGDAVGISDVPAASPASRRAATLTDVATRAGVSQPTASRVLNGSTRTPAADIVHRVRAAAAELGYTPNAQAQALARAASGPIGLLVPDITDPYFATIAGAAQQAALHHARQMMLAVTDRQQDLESHGVEAFVARRAEAIILVGSPPTGPTPGDPPDRAGTMLARHTAQRGRVVVIGPPRPDTHAHTIVPDSRGGAAALADALVTQVGIKDFVLLSGPPYLAGAAERTRGSIDALRAHGIKPRAVLHHEFTRQGGYLSARRVITELAGHQGSPTCLVAGNDVMAIGAMTALRQAGLRIPDEVAVAGFDDIPLAQDVHPSLTTVRLPCRTWAGSPSNSRSAPNPHEQFMSPARSCSAAAPVDPHTPTLHRPAQPEGGEPSP